MYDDIPSDILCDILRRLPADSLLRFRNVSKAWRRIIDDPSFVRSHSIQHANCSSLLIREQKGGCLYSFSLETLNHTKDGDQTIEAAPVAQLVLRSVPRPFPVAVCNGLILIIDFDTRRNWVIWNPLTRDLHIIPPLDPELLGESQWYLSWSLGYDRAADDYKVVRMDKNLTMDRMSFVCKTLVYSLKLGVWRAIKDFPGEIEMGKGVYLNGSLYWRSRENEIIVLDVGTEDYSRLQGPPLPAGCSHEHLEVMGGCLIFSCCDPGMRGLEGWIMGVENSWVKMFLVRGPLFAYYRKPVAYLRKKGAVIVQRWDGTLFLFDLESNTLRKVSIEGMHPAYCMQLGQGSLFRLNNNDGGGAAAAAPGIERKRPHKRWTIHIVQVWKTCFR